MKSFQPYLNFNGNTREAMEFYQKACGGTLDLQTFGEASKVPGTEHRIMHARLSNGDAVLMASDTMPEHPFVQGTNVMVNIDCESDEELDRIFAALSEGAMITMPVQDTFWRARFGMLIDKFGVHWMFNSQH